jgi:hypothetical protein
MLKGLKEVYVEWHYILSRIFVLFFRLLVFYFLWMALVGKEQAASVLCYLILAQIFWYCSPYLVDRKINDEVRLDLACLI